MVVVGGSNLKDELLPELEIHVTMSKLSDTVKVDLCQLSDAFLEFLVQQGCINEDANNDVQIMPFSKFVKFCHAVRDAYCLYNVRQNADV